MQQLSGSEIKTRFPEIRCRELSMFGALSNDSLQFLLAEGRVLEYAAGETLFHDGDASERFYIILDGSLGYFRKEQGEAIHIRSFRTGEQLGYVGMIGLHERRGDAVAEVDSCVLEISCELFHRVCDTFASDFVIFLINMTREMSREITDLDAICSGLSAQLRKR
ncbi:Crp/Fnr family transcriptional regulator [Neptuniibacter halophilus]|uniref:Crp/Fnr family transcriptional regulator n=1 Tax=Neptuniibacter halophilus TaxID=651666 RepID=UPI0025738B3C|nr:cyclic nucleotide-binding domain-containing protein [Neptuniibacter halophilus]